MASTDDAADDTHETLDDIEFLARSPHRVEVLQALAEAPRTRHDLKELADVSRITIRRMLEDFEERGWIVHDNGQYESTATGRVVANEFERLHANMAAADRLDDALPWLPTAEFDFDLVQLRDADVLFASSWPDHAASVSHACELVRGVDLIRGSAIGWTPDVVEVIRDQVVAGETTLEVVVGTAALEMMRAEDTLRERFQDIMTSEAGSLFRYTGEAPLHMVMMMDETVSVCGHTDDGPPPGTLESRNDVVRSWARRYYDSVRENAHPLTVDALAPEHREST